LPSDKTKNPGSLPGLTLFLLLVCNRQVLSSSISRPREKRYQAKFIQGLLERFGRDANQRIHTASHGFPMPCTPEVPSSSSADRYTCIPRFLNSRYLISLVFSGNLYILVTLLISVRVGIPSIDRYPLSAYTLTAALASVTVIL